MTPPKINRTGRSLLSVNPGLLILGTGWGFDFWNLPSTHVEEPPSVTSSDKEVPSDLPLDDSLSTLPAQARGFLTHIHGPVELPPAVPSTGRTAPASLPTQVPGTGRTDPMNLPPTQQSRQSRNPDGMPPPGVVNGPPALTTMTSTRGRGTGSHGKKQSRRKIFGFFPSNLLPFTLSPEIPLVDDAIFVLRDFVYALLISSPNLRYRRPLFFLSDSDSVVRYLQLLTLSISITPSKIIKQRPRYRERWDSK